MHCQVDCLIFNQGFAIEGAPISCGSGAPTDFNGALAKLRKYLNISSQIYLLLFYFNYWVFMFFPDRPKYSGTLLVLRMP